MSTRIEVAITLPEPVTVGEGRKADKILSVEWWANAWYTGDGTLYTRITGHARGNYSVVVNFSRENAPDWAPPCPPDLEDMLLSLMAFEAAHGKTVHL